MPEYQLSSPEEWAKRSEYRLFFADIDPPPVNRPSVERLPDAIEQAIQLHQSQSKYCPLLVEAINVLVIQWHWTGENSNSQYTYFFISRNGDFLISDVELNPIWLKYFPFIKSIKDGIITLEENFENNVSGNVIDTSGFFCGGNLHFGHWISDTLYKFVLDDLFPSCENLFICNHLTKYYREALTYVWSSQKRASRKIAFLPESSKKLTVYQFRKVYIPLQFSLPLRYQLVRRSLSNLIDKNHTSELTGVYLERGLYDSERRILNEEFVTNLMLSRGNIIVRPHALSFANAHKLFNTCRFIVTSFGSSSVNFAIFAKETAKLVCFIPPCYYSTTPEIVLGSAYYQSLSLERTVLLNCLYDDNLHSDVLRRPFRIPEEVFTNIIESIYKNV
jgi:hypothetical protein